MYSKRLGIVEPVFGNIRSQKRKDRFTLRGKLKINIQWLLLIGFAFLSCLQENNGTSDPVNSPPEILSEAKEMLSEVRAGEFYSDTIIATDADQDSLSYETNFNLTGFQVSETGEISWIPTESDTGIHFITIVVSDGKESDSLSFHISVYTDVIKSVFLGNFKIGHPIFKDSISAGTVLEVKFQIEETDAIHLYSKNDYTITVKLNTPKSDTDFAIEAGEASPLLIVDSGLTQIFVKPDINISTGSQFSLMAESAVDSTVKRFLPRLSGVSDRFSTLFGDKSFSITEFDAFDDKIICYKLTGEMHGRWNDSLEFLWNVFAIQSLFFYPVDLNGIQANQNLQELYTCISKEDKWARYLDGDIARQLKEAKAAVKPVAIGIRTLINQTKDTLIISQVAPNSPASKAGLLKGMRILSVDGVPVIGGSCLIKFTELTNGEARTQFNMTLLKNGMDTTVTITKDTVHFPSVQVDTIGAHALIKVYSFSKTTLAGRSTSMEFREALQETKDFVVTILDLRGNSGGTVTEAISMSQEILSAGIILRTLCRSFNEKHIPKTVTSDSLARPGGIGEGRQYIILGDKSTAAAAEIFISALLNNDKIIFAGQTTYGKGVGQETLETPAGGLAIFTSKSYLTGARTSFNGTGIPPTHPVQEGEDILKFAIGFADEM